jgi:agmatine deiminase
VAQPADPPAVHRAEQKLKEIEIDRSNVHLFDQPLNDVWARDCGPVFVYRQINGSHEYVITDWEYNAWGGEVSSL